MRYVFAIALVVGFLGFSHLADRSARGQRSITGIVSAWRGGEYIAVANEQTSGFKIRLRPNTVYEGDAGVIRPGRPTRVTVWYRNVGERQLVADRVRVLGAVLPQ